MKKKWFHDIKIIPGEDAVIVVQTTTKIWLIKEQQSWKELTPILKVVLLGENAIKKHCMLQRNSSQKEE